MDILPYLRLFSQELSSLQPHTQESHPYDSKQDMVTLRHWRDNRRRFLETYTISFKLVITRNFV